MLTRTTELATRWLLFLALEGEGRPLPARQAARTLGCSPTYLSKITSLLVKAVILTSVRGVKGGVTFGRPLSEITLLEVFEACQGLLTAGYCAGLASDGETCSFHQAMKELHEKTTGVLSKWTLQDLLKQPYRSGGADAAECRMFCTSGQMAKGS